MKQIKLKLYGAKQKLKTIFNRRGEGYVDSGVKILIAVVIGALLLAGLYALFNDTVLPTLTEKVRGMFNYTAPSA